MIKRARLIRDVPADADEFFGAGHKRSAVALAEAVRQLSDRDGAIGLEGAWGSGKSTVINLAASNFAQDGAEQYRVFTFDLWLHNPDILKLAFLEEFIAWSKSEKLLKEKQANAFTKRIADKEVSTRIENKREYSWGGILFLLLLPLLPIVYTWLSPLAFSNRTSVPSVIIPFTQVSVGPSTLALLGVGVLYLVFFVSAVFGRLSKRRKTILSALSSAGRLFSRETDFDEVIQWVRERNPTSEEFQAFFREIVSAAQSSGTRIVFVFDNIDRLPSRSVQKVWSEARSIFAMAARGAKPDSSDITAIVPYDMKYISEAFEDKGDQDRPAGERAEHLIRKTFDIALRVAPPLSTDWKKFLDAKLDYAFPTQLDEADKYELFKLFDIQNQSSGLPPTPREIISYINSVGAIWNEWGEKIPVSHMAIYALTNRLLSPATIKSGGILNQRFIALIRDKDVPKSLAALHFNVEPEHAYQILLGQDIERVAVAGDGAEFVELSKSNGFQEVFPDVVRERAEQWARDGAEQFSNLVNNVSQEEVSGDYLREVWDQISTATSYLEECDVDAPESYGGLAKLLSKLGQPAALSRARQLMEWYTRNLPKPEERLEQHGRAWFEFYAALHDVLSVSFDDKTASGFQKSIAVPSGVALNIGLCAQCSQHSSIIHQSFRRPHNSSDLRAAALKLVTSNPEMLWEVLRFKPWFADEDFITNVATAICERLHSGPLKDAERRRLVQSLAKIRSQDDPNGKTRSVIANRSQDGSLVSHASLAAKAEDRLTSARIAWLIADANKGALVPGNPGNHPHLGDVNPHYNDYQVFIDSVEATSDEASEVSRLIGVAGEFSTWTNYATDGTKSPFYQIAFRSLVSNGNYGALNCSTVVAAYDKFRTILDTEELSAFHEHFGKWAQYFPDHFDGANSLKVPISLLDAIASGKADRLVQLVEHVDSYLASLGEDDWTSALEGNNEKLLLVIFSRLRSGSFKPQLEPFRTVLFDHTLALLEEKQSGPDDVDDWYLLFDVLRKDTREKFARALLIRMKDIATTIEGVEAFVSAAKPIAEMLPVSEYPDTSLDQLFSRAVLANAPECTAFVERTIDDIREAVGKATESAKSRFVESLEAARHKGVESDERVTRWAKSLGVILDESTAPEEEAKE